MFLNNAWCVAELSSGLGDGLLSVRLLRRSLVLYRLSDGTVAALEDAVLIASCRCRWGGGGAIWSNAAITA